MTKTLSQIIEDNNLGIFKDPISGIVSGTDKGNPKSYINEFYEKKFFPLKNKPITLVEIGVRDGASICLWKNYFSDKTKIYGIDSLIHLTQTKDYPLNQEWLIGDNVNFIDADAYSQETIDKIDGKIDVLIDDGPHTFESHIKLLELYISKMNKNGMIIIEDISYDPNQLYSYVPENLQDKSYVCDYGGYDNRLIVIQF